MAKPKSTVQLGKFKEVKAAEADSDAFTRFMERALDPGPLRFGERAVDVRRLDGWPAALLINAAPIVTGGLYESNIAGRDARQIAADAAAREWWLRLDRTAREGLYLDFNPRARDYTHADQRAHVWWNGLAVSRRVEIHRAANWLK